MRRAKKAVKYKGNPDAETSLQPVFSSFMRISMHWLNAIADLSSIVGKAVMHSTYKYVIYIYIYKYIKN